MLRPVSHSPSDLRPLALGELIDRAATFWRKHFKTLFLLTLGFNLAVYILTKALQLMMQRNYLALQGAVRGGDLSEMGTEYARLMGMSLGIMVVYLWFHFLNTLVVSRYVVPTLLGEPARPADGIQRAWKRVGAFTGAYALSLLWVVGAILLMVLPGGLLAGTGTAMVMQSSGSGARVAGGVLLGVGLLLMFIGLMGGILWYLLRFSLLAPVMAMEDLPRSWRKGAEVDRPEDHVVRVRLRVPVLFPSVRSDIRIASEAGTVIEDEPLPASQRDGGL